MEPTAPTDAVVLDELAQVLLDVAPTGIMLLCPVYNAEGNSIIDISFEYLNLAA